MTFVEFTTEADTFVDANPVVAVEVPTSNDEVVACPVPEIEIIVAVEVPVMKGLAIAKSVEVAELQEVVVT